MLVEDCKTKSSNNYCRCLCKQGYTGFTVCEDINECLQYAFPPCDPNAQCQNLPGTFSCQCLSGYDGDGIVCDDINECADGTHTCGGMSTCSNLIGSYMCECEQGYFYNSAANQCGMLICKMSA